MINLDFQSLIPLLHSDSPPVGTESLHTFLNEEMMQDKYRMEDFMLAVSVTTKAQLFRWFLCFQTSCWWKSRILGERKSEVYLKVIYFSCCFVGWRGSDRCRLVVYGAWLSAGRAAFLSGSWFSVLGRCSKLEANLSISYSPSTFTALSNFFTPVPLTFLSSISLLTSFTSYPVLFFPHPSLPFLQLCALESEK